MLKPYFIEDYLKEFRTEWAVEMPAGCPPIDIMVPFAHSFFRLAKKSTSCEASDFVSYAEIDPNKNWGNQLPLAVGLSLLDNEEKARKSLKLPFFKQFKGVIVLLLNPTDGVVKQTGSHRSHYTWWRTKSFDMSNLKMLEL